jgi:hypothetical protein
MRPAMFITFFAAVLCACDTPEPPDVLELNDQGSLCLQNDTLYVDFETCLSSSCDTLAVATCSTNVVDGTLSVTSYARIESQGDECTADCGFASAICETPDDTSDLSVAYGGDSLPFSEIPDCQL